MELYLAFFIVALAGSFISNRKVNMSVAVVILMAMCVMVALRASKIGADTQMYMASFRRVKSMERFEHEFLFYNIGVTFIKHGYPRELMQALVTAVTYLPLMWLFPKWSKNACLSVFVMIVAVNGYFLETFNIARQAAATSFLLCAYVSLDNKKLVHALVWIILGIGFHTSTLIYVPFILLAYKVKLPSAAAYVVIAGTLLFAFLISNVGIITGLIKQYSQVAFGDTGKYVGYVTYRLAMARTTMGLVVLLLPCSILCVYAYDRFKDTFMMRIFFWGCVFLNIVSIMPTSYRMAYGMVCAEMMIYPMVLKSDARQKWVPAAVLALVGLYWVAKLSSTLKLSTLVPYQTFL